MNIVYNKSKGRSSRVADETEVFLNILRSVVPPLAVAGLLCACGVTERAVVPQKPSVSAPIQVPPLAAWQIWRTQDRQPIPFDVFLVDISRQDVLYIGEEHHHPSHIEAAAKILQGLLQAGQTPVLAMEMFGWDGQAALDRYLADGTFSRERFLQEVGWAQNWGGAFEDYEPLVRLARDRHLSVVALNPPKPLVRQVAKRGLAQAILSSGMAFWTLRAEDFPEDQAYHDLIVKPLRLCHGGLTDDAYQRMYEASLFRDEGMARTIVEALHRRNRPPGPVVSYTGGGHVQYGLPVPKRVARRMDGQVAQATIYLASYDPSLVDDLRGFMQERIADYLWLTPLSATGIPRRCR
jgi:uncharacterized iron-regulated protein